MRMSRDAREVKNHLEAKSGQQIPPFDLFGIEELVYSFYPNFIKGAIDRFYNPKSKQDPSSIAFYVKPIRSMNKSRRNADWNMTQEQRDIVWKISHYLLDDYNYDQLGIIKQMAETFTPQQVQKAIDNAMKEKVFNVNYLLRIAESVKSLDDYEVSKIQNRRKLFVDGGVNDKTHVRPVYEIASMVASFQDELENIRINKMIEEMGKNDD